MRRRHIWRNGAWIDVTGWKRPAPVFPGIITDGMAPAVHPATGQVLDSKSAFRAVTRAHGLVEMGNDAPSVAPAPAYDGREIKQEIAHAITALEQGWQPPPLDSAGALDGEAVATRIYEAAP